MAPLRALQIHAGPRARAHLLERGLQPGDVKVVAGAAGGPKGLVLLPLDGFIFGQWLPQGGHQVDLIGASIGAWRMAAACMADPVAALRQLGHDYIHERYGPNDGSMPSADVVSLRFRQTLQRHFPTTAMLGVLSHPLWKLHIITSKGRGLLGRAGPVRMPVGFAAAVGLNALSRKWLDLQLQRVWFSPDGQAPSWLLTPKPDLATVEAPLDVENLEDALVASCSIPFWLKPVVDIRSAPPGPYWDGGLTDYHVHLPYHQMRDGLALVPHFQPHLVPGWLDKPWRRRHRSSAFLDNAIVISPSAQWLRSLPGGKIPDRSDFKRYLKQPDERERLWAAALHASEQLAAEWAECVSRPSIEASPLP